LEALTLRRALLSFYRKHGRDLPWRKTRDPYAIWISEVMLQQTQVQTVIPRFAAFLARFPDVLALARADEREVCEAWAGLGYYRRARNLHKAATVLVDRFAGRFPHQEAELRSLPGVGAYTAAAIASIAFGARSAAVDGNLVRVLARVFALPGRASDATLVRAIRERATELVDCDQPGDVNQALMDIGATVCKPEAPSCAACPLLDFCCAHRGKVQAAYPGSRTRTLRKSLRIAFAWIERDGRVLLEQRPLDGLWPGLWELPSASGEDAPDALARRLGQPLGRKLAAVTHELTHRHVTATVYLAAAKKVPAQEWFEHPLAEPISSLARKAILAASKKQPASPARRGLARRASSRSARTTE
jgi:A/G-specific adenine glycosylase